MYLLLSLLDPSLLIFSPARSAGAAQQLQGQAPGRRAIMEHSAAGLSPGLGRKVGPEQGMQPKQCLELEHCGVQLLVNLDAVLNLEAVPGLLAGQCVGRGRVGPQNACRAESSVMSSE